MSNGWAQVVTNTAESYSKEVEDDTVRNRFLFNRLKANGRMTQETGGLDMRWLAQIRQHVVQNGSGLQALSFDAIQPYERYQLEWKTAFSTDIFTHLELAINNGDKAIVRRYSDAIPDMVESVFNKLSKELYQDGYDTANDQHLGLTGLRSCTGAGASTFTAAADYVAYPSDSYGGHSTVLGTQGGSWSSDTTDAEKPNTTGINNDWPFGSGDSQYDWNTPKLIRETSTQFHASSTWATQAPKAVRRAVAALRNTNGKKGRPTIMTSDSGSYAAFADQMEARFSLNKPQLKGTEELGFAGDYMVFEGLEFSDDFDCPAGWKFVLQPSEFEFTTLKSPGQKGMLYQFGPERDPRTNSWLFNVGHIGNLRYRPKGLAAIYAFSTS